jgi:dimethylargininase
MRHALTRHVPNSFASALAMSRPASPIDVALAQRQHLAYCAAIAECGATVTTLPADEACPDCVFVEDTAVIVDNVALITRPGAPSRQAETPPIARALEAWCELVHMAAPATLDGGDVMRVGATMFVGRSARTNEDGIAALRRAVRLHVVPIALPPGVLHLKCVVSPLDAETILLADDSLPHDLFPGLRIVRVPRDETYAANAVAIGRHVVVAAEHPRTHGLLADAGFTPHPVPTTEVCKADGSLTCQSLLW